MGLSHPFCIRPCAEAAAAAAAPVIALFPPKEPLLRSGWLHASNDAPEGVKSGGGEKKSHQLTLGRTSGRTTRRRTKEREGGGICQDTGTGWTREIRKSCTV